MLVQGLEAIYSQAANVEGEMTFQAMGFLQEMTSSYYQQWNQAKILPDKRDLLGKEK